jgi:hypothetical protein
VFDDGTVSVAVPLVSTGRAAGLPDGVAAGLAERRGLPVLPALGSLLPAGLPRGRTVTVAGDVAGSLSLLLALLAGASADGAWCALVDLPGPVGAEALAGYGVALDRTVLVRAPARGWSRAGWLTAVGALVDAFDVVAIRPETRPAPGDAQRLAARVRSHETVLVPYVPDDRGWPGAAIRLRAEDGMWSGLTGDGGGRLERRRVTVAAARHGQEARSRTTTLWLPDRDGSLSVATGRDMADHMTDHMTHDACDRPLRAVR